LEKRDRKIIRSFLRYYLQQLEHDWLKEDMIYPEDDSRIPHDQRIDAILPLDEAELHIEHTSVDLIVSNGINKRSLDPGFLHLEKELKQINCHEGKGVRVTLPLAYAENVAALKQIMTAVKHQVEVYIQNTEPSEWQRCPSRYHSFSIDSRIFHVRPDVLHGSEVSLEWSGSDVNYLEPNELEARIAEGLESKFTKLNNSTKRASKPSYGIILVDTDDVAAQSFHSFSGAFARLIVSAQAELSELWGMHGTNTTPTLIWFDALDSRRTDCPYRDDSTGRSYSQIEYRRIEEWKLGRSAWLQTHKGSILEAGPNCL
jgi:hypothetical protein